MSLTESFYRDSSSSEVRLPVWSGVRFGRVVSADNYMPRMEELSEYLSREGLVDESNISLNLIDRKNPEFYRENFRNQVREALQHQENILVSMNYYVALRYGWLEDVLSEEEKAGIQVSKCLIVSCIARNLIGHALGDRRNRVEYVASSKGDGKIDLGQLRRRLQYNGSVENGWEAGSGD